MKKKRLGLVQIANRPAGLPSIQWSIEALLERSVLTYVGHRSSALLVS